MDAKPGATKLCKFLFYALALILAVHVAWMPYQKSFHFLDFLSLITVAFLAAYLAADTLVKKKSRRRVSIILLVFVFLSLLGAEAVLRGLFPRYRSYLEQNGDSRYFRMFPEQKDIKICSGTLSERKNKCLMDPKVDFIVTKCFNSLGMRGRDLPPGEKGSAYRILALGDSFTEGVGADNQSTWPAQLERLLRKNYNADINVLNAGVSGSYPACEYLTLQQLQPLLDPDMVLLAVNMSDINDFIMHFGYRAEDGTFLPVSSERPDWEWLYGTSFLVRALVQALFTYDPLLQDSSKSVLLTQQAKVCLDRSLRDIAAYCAQKNIAFAVVFHPAAMEVLAKDDQFQALSARLSADDIHAFDTLGYYLSATPLTPDTIYDYYWPHDLHHTPKGYRLLAEAIFHYLKSSDFFTESINGTHKKGA
ncbi:MAG: GDSL-type esterase/lipase family protein [Thermodesulfobacteriota bacterium]